MQNLHIRLIEQRDLKILAKLYCKVYDHFDVGEKWKPASALKLMQYHYNQQPDLFFVAEIDQRIVGGFVAEIQPWWDGNRLINGEIFVDPAYQKHGVGTVLSKALYEKAIKKYRALTFDTITFAKTTYPLAWYSKLGFTKMDNLMLISGNLKKVLKNLKKK
ncbi:GNAT family N-acetyltransferase [Candidatus Woesearchaeota archaeon]|nr:GNAT family N-acetyltransferase [Candidatus Woesearchaeota archaeon]